MSDFQREERYIVVKLKDITLFQQERLREFLAEDAIDTRECVVVEPDWPIYDAVWEMVQRVAEGRAQQVDELAAHVERMTRLWLDMDDCEAGSDEQMLLIYQMHDAVRDHYNDGPTSLARLKAQWQIELLDKIRDWVDGKSIWPCDISDIEDEINRQAEEGEIDGD